MKKTALFVTATLVIVVISAIWLYREYFKSQQTLLKDLVPLHAMLVLEKGECKECSTEFANIPLIKPFLDVDSKSVPQELNDFLFSEASRFISVHLNARDNFDYVFFQDEKALSVRNTIFEKLKADKSVRYSTRMLDGVRLEEFNFGDKTLTTVALENFWVSSFTPFLIEDIVRLSKNQSGSFFNSANNQWKQHPQVKGDAGNIYVNYLELPSFLKIFKNSFSIPDFARVASLDVKKAETGLIELNGFTTAGDTTDFLSLFINQSPVSFDLKSIISNEALFVMSLGISDSEKFSTRLLREKSNTSDSLRKFLKPLEAQLKTLVPTLDNEMSVCYLQGITHNMSKVLLVETKSIGRWVDSFQQLSKQTETGDTLFAEFFGDFKIQRIDINNLPTYLFHPVIQEFKISYYTFHNNVVIIAEDLPVLKNFLQDIEDGNTWGRTVSYNRFFESILLESNLSFYFDIARILTSIEPTLENRWRTKFSNQRQAIRKFELGAIQFSNLSEYFYSNLFFTYSADTKSNVVEKRDLVLTSGIKSGPYVVKSHVHRKHEIVFEDSSGNLCLLDAAGKIAWKYALGSAVTSDIKEVDFFKNGKLQYFFSTHDKLHIVDRLGNVVQPFPLGVGALTFQNARVVDYDRSKNYRFLLHDQENRIWLTDKTGELLDGWKPLKHDKSSELAFAPAHFRVNGSDYFIVVDKNGIIYLYTRRGELIKGFPLKTELRPMGNFFIEPGKTQAATQIILISKDGFRLKVNLNGEVVSKETLVKTSVESSFAMVKEANEKSYLIARSDSRKVTLLRPGGEEILSNEFIGQSEFEVSYLDFGLQNSFILITDRSQELVYVYSGDGSPLFQTPVEGHSATIVPSDNRFDLVIASDQTLKRLPIQ